MERRAQARYPVSGSLEGACPSTGTGGKLDSRRLNGVVVDVSAGGICVLGEGDVEVRSILPCRFRLPSMPVAIPVLTQVRWIESPSTPEGLRHFGLAFLT